MTLARRMLMVSTARGFVLVSSGDSNEVHRLDPADGSVMWTYTGHGANVRAVAVSPDGDRVYSGSDDDEVHEIDASDGSQGWVYTGHGDDVYAIAVS